ncbi:TetR/AcrR family transcriptional regulator [Grimontia sp. NTOU-MAR1]|uniref:TetR/AcrR family transcriptional regulator n=1 Tax=Grimontia sp. NTOU-MAR1 TaxID=3111011 RepID=UPI002DB69F8D|nr:TetR/AcrR family transcriptional regulator [Grimontia sp. NTOU-MAR1]WRW00965.1 TetR/AcrR family transcriptional regulator [Grimontia sp. NTOU-MAR1]
MPWPTTKKQETRKKILKSAVRLFANKGFHNVSLGEVMRDAKLTHGAFYAHFSSKQELYKEAVYAATEDSPLAGILRESDGNLSFEKIVKTYLCEEHVEQKVSPCPLAAFATDVSSLDGDAKNAYSHVFEGLLEILQTRSGGEIPDRKSAMSLAALMIGGVVVSRALKDEDVIHELLEACITKAALFKATNLSE